MRSRRGPVEPAPVPRPVDPGHVANPDPGWYHGDFHMHSFHSNPKGPTPQQFVEHAKRARLDFTPVTEYVVGVHWDEYGPVQEENPGLLIWPGREIVTYFGHMQCIGETPGFVEYRHGFEGVDVAEIQRAVRSSGALFQVNHPTTFKGRLFANFCRGCAFDLGDRIDWSAVDTVEVLNGPAVLHRSRLLGGDFENPFMTSAIELWEAMLDRGYATTAVSGSDAKRGIGLGSSATAVHADQLSRAALTEAIRAGRAYVRTRGVAGSPALTLTVSPAAGSQGTFGGRFVVDPGATVPVSVVVRGGDGQRLRLIRNGAVVDVVRIVGDPFEHRFQAGRARRMRAPRHVVADRDLRPRLTDDDRQPDLPRRGGPPAGAVAGGTDAGCQEAVPAQPGCRAGAALHPRDVGRWRAPGRRRDRSPPSTPPDTCNVVVAVRRN